MQVSGFSKIQDNRFQDQSSHRNTICFASEVLFSKVPSTQQTFGPAKVNSNAFKICPRKSMYCICPAFILVFLQFLRTLNSAHSLPFKYSFIASLTVPSYHFLLFPCVKYHVVSLHMFCNEECSLFKAFQTSESAHFRGNTASAEGS